MALPTSLYVETLPRYKPAGVTCEVYPSTVRGLKVELQAATANSTASSVWASHIFGPSTGGPLRYTVPIAESTRLYYFRARHPAGNGYSAGPFLPVISARSKLTPDTIHPFVMQMSYQGNMEAPSGSDVFVSSAKTVKVGTQPTTGSLTKPLRVPQESARPDSSTELWEVANGYLQSGSNTIPLDAKAPVALARGVQITKLRMRSFKETTSDEVIGSLFRISSTGGRTSLSVVTQGSTGWITSEGSAIAETITTAYSYHVQVFVNPSTAKANARFLWWELDYKMGEYADSV